MSSVFQKSRCRHRRCECDDYCGRRRYCENSCESELMDIDSPHLFGIIDPSQTEALANHFLEEYYHNVSNIGWNAVMHLYIPDAIITCNTHVYSGGYEFLNALSGEYIRRANFDNIGATWALVDESKMVVTVFGEINFVGFTGDCSGVGHFADTFVLKAYPNETYGVVCHNFYFS